MRRLVRGRAPQFGSGVGARNAHSPWIFVVAYALQAHDSVLQSGFNLTVKTPGVTKNMKLGYGVSLPFRIIAVLGYRSSRCQGPRLSCWANKDPTFRRQRVQPRLLYIAVGGHAALEASYSWKLAMCVCVCARACVDSYSADSLKSWQL